MKLFREISKINLYLFLSSIVILFGLILLITFDKKDIHLTINEQYNGFFDFFFTYITYFGDGVFAAIAVIPVGIILWKKYKWRTFAFGWITLLYCGILAQSLKRLVYPNADRPLKFLGKEVLRLVSDVEVHTTHSFPSGHTTCAFALYGFFAFLLAKYGKLWQFVLFLIAGLIGYSRMYLSQHFLEDVVFGAFLGLISCILGYVTYRIIPNSKPF